MIQFKLKNSLLITTIILISSMPLSSQSLNSDFIKSLPSDVREDVLSNIDKNQQQKDEKAYGYIETDIQDVTSILEGLKDEIAAVENKIEQYSTEYSSNDLIRFGDQFFSSIQTTFMPVTSPGLSGGYVVDVNDSLEVMLVGQKNEKYDLSVFRDGSISIPEIGKVYVAGLDFSEVTKLIGATVQQNFIGVEAFVSLSSMRDMNILLVGNVKNPGTYTIAGNSSIIHAIHAAGGLDNSGSYRNIEVKRENEIIDTVDLYEALSFGNIKFNHTLRSGDVILVKSAKNEVSLVGALANEGIFEVKNSETLEDIINFAGGFDQSYDSEEGIFVRRQTTKAKNEIALDSPNDFKLKNNDVVMVPSYKPSLHSGQYVTISGEVHNPGRYLLKDGMKLSDLVMQAGGYTRYSYQESGKLFRMSAKNIESKINQKLYNETIEYISSAAQNPAQGSIGVQSNLGLILSEFKKIQPTGRVSAEFDLSKIYSDPTLDTILEANDVVEIPQFSNTVYVLGEVIQPGGKAYQPSDTPFDYIRSTGGLDRFGDKDRIVLIRPNGDAYVASKMSITKFFADERLEVVPGSIIYVPREIGKLDTLGLAATIAPIFSSLAISVASINSIDRN